MDLLLEDPTLNGPTRQKIVAKSAEVKRSDRMSLE